MIDEIIKTDTCQKLYPSIVNIDLLQRSKICTVDKFKISNNQLQDLDSFLQQDFVSFLQEISSWQQLFIWDSDNLIDWDNFNIGDKGGDVFEDIWSLLILLKLKVNV